MNRNKEYFTMSGKSRKTLNTKKFSFVEENLYYRRLKTGYVPYHQE